MVTETMNIHKALCELKILNSRIEKEIHNTTFIAVATANDSKVDGVSREQKIKDIKSDYQSIIDLMRRRDAIKQAVMVSNATTDVTISGVTYKVAAAIEMMQHGIEHKKELHRTMERAYALAVRTYGNTNEQVKRNAETYVSSVFGTKEKANGADAQKALETYIANNSIEIVDPLSLSVKMKELSDEIDAFETEVHSALSSSNALTSITISY